VPEPVGVRVRERNEQAGYRSSAKLDEALLMSLSWSPTSLHTTLTTGFLLLGLCPLLLVPWGGEIGFIGATLTVALSPLTCLMAYDFLGKRFNHTEIRVEHRLIVTRHRPLPWMGNKSVAADRIRGVEVHERGQGAKYVCAVWVRLDDDGSDWLLRSNISIGMNREQAEYIAQRIRTHLHLGSKP
jgi:hypothetical protein